MLERQYAIATVTPCEIGQVVYAPQARRIVREISRAEFLHCLAESEQDPARRFAKLTTETGQYEPLHELSPLPLYFYRAQLVED